MVAGVYLVLARGWTDNVWIVALAGVPFGLSVVSINPLMLIVFLAWKRLLYAVGVLTKPRPAEPPKEWPAWPAWFSGFAFYHNRLYANLFTLGLFADVLLRIFLSGFWPVR